MIPRILDHPPRWAAHFLDLVVSSGERDAIYLTFDDGPDPDTTPRFLDVLGEFECPATFFQLGARIDRHTGIVKRVAVEGHTIGIHGYEHLRWLMKSAEWIKSEISRTVDAIKDASGLEPRLVRPPHGAIGPGALKAVREAGGKIVLWNLSLSDWRPIDTAELTYSALDRARGGDIILLHDSGKGAESTLKALPGIITGLRERGFKLAKLGQSL